MNITRLKIHNFRSIIEQEIFVQKFSLFIVANNAGVNIDKVDRFKLYEIERCT